MFDGEALPGQEVMLHGEFTDANCLMGNGNHAYDHAFCAKACAAAGSPIVFIADSGKVYLALNSIMGVSLPQAALDDSGVPGISATGGGAAHQSRLGARFDNEWWFTISLRAENSALIPGIAPGARYAARDGP